MTAIRRNNYADRAQAFTASAAAARRAGDLTQAIRLEDMASRAQTAHDTQSWRTFEGLRYDTDDCCTECAEHLSDPHQPDCIYGDISHAVA